MGSFKAWCYYKAVACFGASAWEATENDPNIVGSRNVGAVNNMPASLGTLAYETQVWYLSAR